MGEATKEIVRARVAALCEYCHLPERHVVTPFNVEHIVARQHGGKDNPGNLCYACKN